jgi:dTDP-4-dehydrorhamnose reductase
LRYVLSTRNKLDIAERGSVERAIEQHRPWAIINTLDTPDINDAENVPNACYRENVVGTATLAELCAAEEIALVNFSSDCVFDGKRQSPYV